MPASPPAVDIMSLAAQPVGWFVDFGNGKAAEVVCWGLLSDKSGGVPMVFDQASGKLLPASAIGTGYRLFHSSPPGNPDAFATLLENETEPGTSPVASLGGFYSRKTAYVTATAGAVFSAHLEGSADGEHWTAFGGTFDKPDIRSEVMLTIHYVKAVLDSISTGAVTIRMAWSLCPD